MINGIMGSIRVIFTSYPLFLRMSYSESDNSFTYAVLDMNYEEIIEGTVIIITFPYEVRAECSIVFNSEVVGSDDNLTYLLSDPIWTDRNSPLSFEVNWIAVENAEYYQLTYEYGTSGEVVLVSDHTDTKKFVQNLTPDTSYLLKLYAKIAGSSE